MKRAVKIYDDAFGEVGISGDYRSFTCKDCFREAGGAKLVLPAGGTAELLLPDGYVVAPHGVMYRIIRVERDASAGVVTAECESLTGLLRGTVIPEEYTLMGGADFLMYALVQKSSGRLPLPLTVGDYVPSESVHLASGRSLLYDDLLSLCYLGGVGMKLEKSGSSMKFSVVPVRDRTDGSDSPVVASPKIGTFLAERVTRDCASWRNVAVVSGAERELGGRYVVTVGEVPDGDFERQMQVNFTAPVRPFMYENSDGLLQLNEEEYLAAMRLAGAAALGRMKRKCELYGVTDCEDVAPGDKVSVYDETDGISGSAIAEAVVREYTADGVTVKCELRAETFPQQFTS